MTLEFLLTDAFPFTVAIMVMVLLGVLQVVGLSTDAFDLEWLDADHDGHADNDFLSWLGVGTLPLSVILVVMLATFGASGIAIQSFVSLPYLIVVPLALGASFAATGVIAPMLAKIWPQDETTAIELDALLGKRATIIGGTTKPGRLTEAKVQDVYGQTHYIMLEPHADYEIPNGAEVLLVSRVGNTFRGMDPTGGFRPMEREGHV